MLSFLTQVPIINSIDVGSAPSIDDMDNPPQNKTAKSKAVCSPDISKAQWNCLFNTIDKVSVDVHVTHLSYE